MAGETLPQNIVPLPRVEGELGFVQALNCLTVLPSLLSTLQQLQRQVADLSEQVASRRGEGDARVGWLDAEGARKYLSMSAGTFDKYRYKTSPRIPGHALDGKVLYHPTDLDNFVRLYELKAGGLA
jgi:hypothetical protein